MKKIQNLTKTVQINAKFTAKQWQLFTCSYDCTQAAMELNEALMAAVNAGDARNIVESKVYSVMRKNAYYGAADTEPRWFLNDVLDQIYGEEN